MPRLTLIAALLFLLVATSTSRAAEVLKWDGYEKDPHPCLYVTAADVAAAKKARSGQLAHLAQIGNFNTNGNIDQLIMAALLTDNPAAHRAVVAGAKDWLDRLLAALPQTFSQNKGPHVYAQVVGMAAGLADAALAMPDISAEDRTAIVEKIARICYQINRPDYWGFNPWRVSYNPNMWTSAVGYRLTFAALIPSHPKSKEWFDRALAEHKQQIDDWIDPRGGHAEAPHYAVVSFNQWLGSFVIARNAGAPDDGHLFDAKVKLGAINLANITTPAGVLPSLGHTYANERTNTFGLMAMLWKDKDPEFAAHMAWMHERHGRFGAPGILSYYPAFMGYGRFFAESNVKPKQPDWTSEAYPEVGVKLRNTFGERETTLYMIAGRHHNHYFNDSGSITVWGKGVEFCHEDDYQKRRPPVSGPYQVGMYRESHSMPDKPSTYSVERVMDLREFSTSEHFDYTSGVRQGWTRQIAFVKDQNPLAPNYFVIADTFDKSAAPTIWRLYLKGAISPIANGVTVNSGTDVVMDVIFLPIGSYQAQIKKDHIHVPVPKAGTLTAVLYPRMKTEKTPAVTMAGDGHAIEVKSAAGSDLIYLSPTEVTGKLGGKAFAGKAGLAKTRGGNTVVAMPDNCDVEPGWEGGDPQTRELRWEGPQFPIFPDYEEAVVPNQGDTLIVGGDEPATAGSFTLPVHGTKPRQATTVAVSADDTSLDLLFTCDDRDVLAEFSDNDNIKLWKDDSVYVWIDTRHTHQDKQQYVMLQVSASGAWHDLKNGDAAWNAQGLNVDISRTTSGWTAHVRVPWNSLSKSKPKAGDVWGINFSRMDQPGKVDLATMQMSSWVSIPNGSGLDDPDRWGHLLFATNGDDTAARAAMEKVHNAIKARAFSDEALLGF